MISFNTGQPCVLANLQTDKIQHGVSATLATHMPFIASPAPTSHAWVEFLQFSAVFMSVPRCEEGKHTHKERDLHILAKHGLCKSWGIYGQHRPQDALFSTSRTRSCLSRKREKKALSDSVTQCHCKRAHMKETIGEKSQSFMLSGKKYDKYAWYDKLLTSMSKKNAAAGEHLCSELWTQPFLS